MLKITFFFMLKIEFIKNFKHGVANYGGLLNELIGRNTGGEIMIIEETNNSIRPI